MTGQLTKPFIGLDPVTGMIVLVVAVTLLLLAALGLAKAMFCSAKSIAPPQATSPDSDPREPDG
jgi:hypothetical protein